MVHSQIDGRFMTNEIEGRKEIPRLAIVIPCYNEQDVLDMTATVIKQKLSELIERNNIAPDSFIMLVDDGSTDHTWDEILSLHQTNKEVFHGLKFAHNSGHQNALYAGLMRALELGCDAAVSMDADLQDDPDAIEGMVEEYIRGFEIVYGVRKSREKDTFFKRNSARAFYTMMTWLGADTINNHADYRLMGKYAIEALSQYDERNLFLRGVIPSLGFKHTMVYYERGVRVAGESKYPLKKMAAFAVQGITSFSTKPLRIISSIGFISVILGIAMFIYTLVSIISGQAVAGWGSLICSVWILGGLILVSLGTVGEYIGKIYLEVKHRPRYIIESKI